MQHGIIQGKYKLLEPIGEGQFSTVYKGISLKSGEPVAIKVEKPLYEGEEAIRILKREATILNYLGRTVSNLPKIHWFGNICSGSNSTPSSCLVIPFYEYSLHDFSFGHSRIQEEQICTFRKEMISILRQVHMKGVIHRDIKPHNFMVRSGEVYLIDFGLAIFYRNGNGVHIEDRKRKEPETLIGTPNYVSLYVHTGHTPSRRDDMISLEYVCMMLRGEMPTDSADIVSWKREQLLSADNDSSLKRAYQVGFMESPRYE